MSKRAEPTAADEFAIIGMNGRFPGARNLAEFWRNVSEGVESVTFFSDQELLDEGIAESVFQGQDYVKAGSILADIDLFDAAFFGITPREAESMDPQHRIFLECAWHALEDSGYAPEGFAGSIGVFAGCARSTYWDYLNRFPHFTKKLGYLQIMLGNDKDYLTTYTSWKLNLTGPSVCVQSSCSTSLVAVNQACQSLRTRQCDVALAGGICIRVPDRAGYQHQAGGIFSPDGHSRVFDADAQGMVFGNGVGLVVLRRLADAIEAGDHIHAVIKSCAITNDGASKGSYTAPSVTGQMAAITGALQSAGVHPDTISYVEAHGTGTAVGDPVEVAALSQAYRQATDRVGYCALGSVKSNFGHLDNAAGMAGLIKTVLALEHRRIPPSLHFQQPNPAIDFAGSPFYVNTTLREWESDQGPLRAGVSAFSMGGTNVHAILEEAPPPAQPAPARANQLVVVSGRTRHALEAVRENLAGHLEDNPQINLADVAYTCQVGRKALSHRRFILCNTVQDAVAGLRSTESTRGSSGIVPAGEVSVALMFSGQGTQYLHMAGELFRKEPVFSEQVSTCAEILQPLLGLDLRQLIYPDGEQTEAAARLRQTAITQPALFTIEYSLAKLLQSWGVRPAAMIGHSLGEYVAACLAGVFSLETALALVARRSRLMQDLPPGAMLAVNLPEHDLGRLLNDRVCLAAVNESAQCVVSGPIGDIERLQDQLVREGVFCRRLQTSHAFHSAMMNPMLESYRAFVKQFQLNEPAIPYLSNVTGTWADARVTSPDYWVDHIRQPVRFAAGLSGLLQGPRHVLLEIGPGQTLCSFARRHPDKSAEHVVFSSLRARHERTADTTFLLETLGRLWVAGVEVDWAGFHARHRRRRVPLPVYPFERRRYWVDPPTAPEKKPDVADWCYVPSWTEEVPALAGHAEPNGHAHTWLVFQDDLGVGAHLRTQLEMVGHQVTVVRPGDEFARIDHRTYEIDPCEPSHYQALVGDLCARGDVPDRIAHLWSLSDGLPAGDFDAIQDRGLYSLIATAQALVTHNITTKVRIGIIGNHVHRITDDEPICPAKATVLGAAKVIAQEYPNLRCFTVDPGPIDASCLHESDLIGRLISEFEVELPGTVAAYRDGRRLWQTYEPVRLERPLVSGPFLRRGGVYLITGGMGRIGLTLAETLAASLQARLVLVGRTRLPERAGWDDWLQTHAEDDPISRKIQAVQAIEQRGGRVLVLAADVSCEKQMHAVLDCTIAEFGSLHGVIHGAGTLSADDFLGLDQVERAACDRHFAPKVAGTLVLARLLRRRKCDFCLLVSSLSSVLGGLGYLAYSSANAFLDAFAVHADQVGGTHWRCINWDNWAFPDGPADGLAMLPAEGVETFMRFLGNPPANQAIISTYDLKYRIGLWVNRGRGVSAGEGNGDHARPELTTEYAAPRDEVEQTIAALYAETLGIRDVGIYDNFFELGGQSLLATELASRVRAAFKVELPLRQFLEAPTVVDLARVVSRLLLVEEPITQVVARTPSPGETSIPA